MFYAKINEKPIPLKVIASILGHKDTRLIHKHYGHLRIEDIFHILERSEKAKERILKERGDRTEKENQIDMRSCIHVSL